MPVSVHLPDKSAMHNSQEGYLNLPPPSAKACKTYLFNDMQSSLVSIGQLCNDGCVAAFTNENVFIKKDNVLIIQGHRDLATGLWTADLNNPTPSNPRVVEDGFTFISHSRNQSQAHQADQKSCNSSPKKPSVSFASTKRSQAFDNQTPSATPSNMPSTVPSNRGRKTSSLKREPVTPSCLSQRNPELCRVSIKKFPQNSATPSTKPSTVPSAVPSTVPSDAPSLEPSVASSAAPNLAPSDAAPNNAIAQHVALSAIASKTLCERIKLLHACAGSPALSSFKKAIDEHHCPTWPELTLAQGIKCLVAPAATIKAHLDQQRKGINSTKHQAKPKSTKPCQFPGVLETSNNQQPNVPKKDATMFFSPAPRSQAKSVPTNPASSFAPQPPACLT
jgi:hypothetical protein